MSVLENHGADLSSQTVMLSLTRLSRLAQEARLSPASFPGRAASQVVRLRPAAAGSSEAPLVLFHPAGGSIVPYRTLAAAMQPGRPVLGVQCQVDSALNTLRHASIAEVAADYGDQLAAVAPLENAVLCGYSMGGMIAFELACQLQRRGVTVAGVVLIDTPSRYCARPQSGEPVTANGLLFFAHMLAGRQGRKLELDAADLQAQEPARRIECVIERLREQGLIEGNADLELFKNIYRLIRHNELLSRGFRPDSFDGQVTLLRTAERVDEFAAETHDVYDDPAFGWEPHCTLPVRTMTTPGHHFNVLYAPQVEYLAQNLRSALDNSAAERTA